MCVAGKKPESGSHNKSLEKSKNEQYGSPKAPKVQKIPIFPNQNLDFCLFVCLISLFSLEVSQKLTILK